MIKGERMNNCSHIWDIEGNRGPTSRGTCRLCGETREFNNSFEPNKNPRKFIPDSLTTGKIKRPRKVKA